MNALAAFKAAGEGIYDMIPTQLVPNLADLVVGSLPYAQSVSIMYKWLSQQGLTMREIMAKTPAEWNGIKYMADRGLKSLFDEAVETLVKQIPRSTNEWGDVALAFMIPGGQKSVHEMKRAWTHFLHQNHVKDADPTVFDKFMRAFSKGEHADQQVSDIHHVLDNIRNGGIITTEQQEAAAELVTDIADAQPVYLRALRDEYIELRPEMMKPDPGQVMSSSEYHATGALEEVAESTNTWLRDEVGTFLDKEIEMLPFSQQKGALLGKLLKNRPNDEALKQKVANYIEEYDEFRAEPDVVSAGKRVVEPTTLENIGAALDDRVSAAANEDLILGPKTAFELEQRWEHPPATAPWHSAPEVTTEEMMEAFKPVHDDPIIAALQDMVNHPGSTRAQKTFDDIIDVADDDWFEAGEISFPTEVDTDFIDFGGSPLAGSTDRLTMMDRIRGDLLLADTQGPTAPNTGLLEDIDEFIEALHSETREGLSITQRVAWEALDATKSVTKNKALMDEVSQYIDGLASKKTPGDVVYESFVKAWRAGENTGIRPAPAEYLGGVEPILSRQGGYVRGDLPPLGDDIKLNQGWDPGELKVTRVDVSDMNLEGVNEITLAGVDPENFDRDAFRSGIKTLVEEEESGVSFLTKLGNVNWGRTLGILGLNMVAGMGLEAAMHNDDQWMILNTMVGAALGPIGAAAAVGFTAANKYFIDWVGRQQAYKDSLGHTLNQVCYIRSGNKWVPAIVDHRQEPTEGATFLDVFGRDENWEGAEKLFVRTGYGLTVNEAGDLAWLKPGRTDTIIARKSDFDWHTGQATGPNEALEWKPWTTVWYPTNDYAQQDLIESGMFNSIDATPLSDIYSNLGSSDRFKSAIELQAMLHDNHVLHPAFSGRLDENGVWQADHPEAFTTTAREDWTMWGYKSGFWRDLSASDEIGFQLENQNPDNKWEWGVQSHHDALGNLLKYYAQSIKSQYEQLSIEARREVKQSPVENIPDTAEAFQTYLQTIADQPGESYEAKNFRITQAQLRFATLQGTRFYHDQDGSEHENTDHSSGLPYISGVISDDMWDAYKNALSYLIDVDPNAAISELQRGDSGYETLYGNHPQAWASTNAYGMRTAPEITHGVIIPKSSVLASVDPTQGLMRVGNKAFMSEWRDHPFMTPLLATKPNAMPRPDYQPPAADIELAQGIASVAPDQSATVFTDSQTFGASDWLGYFDAGL